MRLFVRITRVLLVSLALAWLVSLVARPLTAQAQTSAPASLGDPTGATTGTARDVTVKDAANPQLAEVMEAVGHNKIAINMVWVLFAGFLVMFMQAGFALVEAGFTRAKNVAHTMTMNFMVYAIGLFGYWACGYALQMGGVGAVATLGGTPGLNHEFTISLFGKTFGLFGTKGFFLSGDTYDVGVFALFLFQMVFMDTAATIPTGAMAERWKWSSFVVFSFFLSMIVYPIFANWVWGGGWLSQLGKVGLGSGYVDFAGSGVVHAVGGWVALAGATVLGPRLGKYNRDGSANAIPGHNIVLATLGTFILAFGWFGFNPGSTLGASGNGNLRMGMVAVATMIACAGSTLSAMGYSYMTLKKWDPGYIINGFLAGLVAITAPSGFVSPLSGLFIGLIAGVLVCVSLGFIEKVLKVDDPVGAISVHGVNGLWGQLAVGIFADGTMDYGGTVVKGLIVGDVTQLIAQLIGAVVAFAWAFGVGYVFFKVLEVVMGNRVSAEVELAGLDIPETGSWGYQVDDSPGESAWPMPNRRPLPVAGMPAPALVPADAGT